MNTATPELTLLAQRATHYLLAQQPISITHAAGWERNGLPLPIKRMKPNDDGTTTQYYRPMEILQYVHEVLSGEMAARRMRDRKAQKEEKEAV